MSRWSKYLGNSVNFAVEKTEEEGFLENFFEKRTFVPRNKQEMQEYEDFSFVSTALSLTVYIALADKEVSEQERERIFSEMIYQLEQHRNEYSELSEKFGSADKEIVATLFKKFKDEIESGNYDLDNNIRIINMIYDKNPYKKNFLLRLAYIVSLTDTKDKNKGLEATKKIADKLKIDQDERDRIKKEVISEYKFDQG